MSKWHVWSINQQRHKKVEDFLQELEEVEDYIYPVVEKEYITKKGKKTKDVPVYSNYIFVKCDYCGEMDVMMNKCQWIKQYVGPCSEDEVKKIREMNGQDYDDVMPNDFGIKAGMKVTLKKNGFLVTVEDVRRDKLLVSIELFGQTKVFDCSVEDIQIGD